MYATVNKNATFKNQRPFHRAQRKFRVRKNEQVKGWVYHNIWCMQEKEKPELSYVKIHTSVSKTLRAGSNGHLSWFLGTSP